FFVYPGAEHTGKIFVVDIGIPADAPQYPLVKRSALEKSYGKALFPKRNRNTHKNHYGHLLCIGGLSGKSGALLLSGLSALRTGAGLCTIATDSATASNIEGRIPELMVEAAGGIEKDAFSFDPEKASRLIEGKSAIVIGMGLSRREGVISFLEFVLSNCKVPVVVDADAINLLSENREMMDAAKKTRAVFTPHPGELSRIYGISAGDVQSRRLFYAEKSALDFGAVFVLKGANSIISAPDGRTSVNTTGNPGMASGGTGDSLSGIIGALLAMGNPLYESACCSVLLHGIAGDLAAAEKGEYSMLATDLIAKIPEVIKEWQA
ncbi:MAG: NAD(P)H-hydrate dehydratase, partial [Deltaproteobacteria bacterium]|nr:NAD(P)H-hydrate dehydratase [Deltaproteobacteria bacterium]